MATNAEHQAAHRKRVKELIERLQTENREMRQRLTTGHAACDARIAELEAEVRRLHAGWRVTTQ
jgi:hypothetical protein